MLQAVQYSCAATVWRATGNRVCNVQLHIQHGGVRCNMEITEMTIQQAEIELLMDECNIYMIDEYKLLP